MDSMIPYKAFFLPKNCKLNRETLILLHIANNKYEEYKKMQKEYNFNLEEYLDLSFWLPIWLPRKRGRKNDTDDSVDTDDIETSETDCLRTDDTVESVETDCLRTDDTVESVETDCYKDNKQCIYKNGLEEIDNLRKTLIWGKENLKEQNFNVDMINYMNRMLLTNVRGFNKTPGEIRKNQNHIISRNNVQDKIKFTPSAPEEVLDLLTNLIEYMNVSSDEDDFIKTAITHIQFESIHPYRDGNGRTGRAIMVLQLDKLKNHDSKLFLFETINLNKNDYCKALNKGKNGDFSYFINFFLRCVIVQCTKNIARMKMYQNDCSQDEILTYKKEIRSYGMR